MNETQINQQIQAKHPEREQTKTQRIRKKKQDWSFYSSSNNDGQIEQCFEVTVEVENSIYTA